jgi:signal transduction histidine kinase
MRRDPDPVKGSRRIGVRARATLVAVVVVGVVLAVSALAFVAVTRDRIESSIADAVEARVDGIVALVAADALADPLPGRDPELLAQVIDGAGAVVAADAGLSGIPPFAQTLPAQGVRSEERVESLLEDAAEQLGEEYDDLLDEGPYVLVAEGVQLPGGVGAVMVASSLEDASEALGAATPLLGIGLPLLLLIVGATTWVLTGRALRPVEEMRVEADRISAAALDLRLPDPGTRDEIQRLAVTLNEMLDRLETSVRQQRRFVADASHELKSPLAALRAMVDVTERSARSEDERRLMADLREEIDRMQRLAGDLLYLARFDEGRPEGVRRTEVDLAEIAAAEAAALATRTELRVDTAGLSPAGVTGDPDRLLQLVRNLTDNAAGHAAGAVWLETGETDGTAILRVSDDGPGIPAEDRERVFERFVRLDESRTRRTGGTGLGLSVARAVARSHGGELRAVDPLHTGATLEARLPARSVEGAPGSD